MHDNFHRLGLVAALVMTAVLVDSSVRAADTEKPRLAPAEAKSKVVENSVVKVISATSSRAKRSSCF